MQTVCESSDFWTLEETLRGNSRRLYQQSLSCYWPITLVTNIVRSEWRPWPSLPARASSQRMSAKSIWMKLFMLTFVSIKSRMRPWTRSKLLIIQIFAYFRWLEKARSAQCTKPCGATNMWLSKTSKWMQTAPFSLRYKHKGTLPAQSAHITNVWWNKTLKNGPISH